MSNHAYVSPRGTTTPTKVNSILKKAVAEDLRGLFELKRESDVYWSVGVPDDTGFGATVTLRSKRSVSIRPGHLGDLSGYVLWTLQTRLATELVGRCSDDSSTEISDPDPVGKFPTFYSYVAHIHNNFPENQQYEYRQVLVRQRAYWEKTLPERLQPLLDGWPD